MSEDIFSQFFNLFNNEESGVNWELAKQINNHITKDEEVLPPELSNNDINFEQIFRVIELQSEEFLSYESIPCLLYTSPSPRDDELSRMPSSA